jgi:hypothetical protein
MPLPFPPERINELTGSRKAVIGGGLDRSKRLWGGDSTIWTCTLKCASATSLEPEYHILNQQVIEPNSARFIRKRSLPTMNATTSTSSA